MIRFSRIAASVVALGAIIVAPESLADCTLPKAPTNIPDGKKATKEEMIAAQTVIKQYVAEIEDVYLKCVDNEANPPPAEGATPEQKKAYLAREKAKAERHNVAVDEEGKVSALFNEQIKIWKATQASK